MSPAPYTERPDDTVDRIKILVALVLNIFTTPELIRELRCRKVIVGEGYQTLHPDWVKAPDPWEPPS